MFIRRYLLTFCLLLITAATQAGERPTPPNVLLVLLDDAGYSDVAGFGRNDAPTPNLQQLAAQGVRFTRHYADSTCKPARMSLLAGRPSADLVTQPDFRGISAELVTLPEALHAAGYHTYHIGKWHLGDTHPSTRPEAQGFDDWFGFLTQFRLRGPDKHGNTNRRPTYENPWLEGKNLPYQPHQGHLETLLADQLIAHLQKLPAKQPWFINYWPFAPHNPAQAAPEWLAKYPDTPAGRYDALLAQVDFEIGRVLAAIRARGEWSNTLIVVASDNGGTNQMKDNNAPYSGIKGEFLEGSLRTPLIVRWPDQRNAGQTRDAIVAIQDIYPTILTAAGISAPAFNRDYDLSRVAAGQPTPPRILIHELLSIGSFDYSVLDKDGQSRLTYTGLKQVPNNQPFNNLALQTQLQQHYYRWREQKIELAVTITPQADGGWRVSGQDLLRTPGFGALSILLPLQLPPQAPKRNVVLARQENVWSLVLTDSQRLQLEFAGHQWRSEPLAKTRWGHCQTVTVSFWQTQSRLAEQHNLSGIEIFVGGDRLLHRLDKETVVDNFEVSAPTEIGGDSAVPVGRPILLNSGLQQQGELHRIEPRAQAACGKAD